MMSCPPTGGKCHRSGPMTRNGFLNFLREFRKNHCGLTVVEMSVQAAKEWNKMSEAQKNSYVKGESRPMRRRANRSSRLSKTCARPGPITRNGYLNFLRDFRKCQCGRSAVEIVKAGAKEWNKLDYSTKNQYIQKAMKTPRMRSRRMSRRGRLGRGRGGRGRGGRGRKSRMRR